MPLLGSDVTAPTIGIAIGTQAAEPCSLLIEVCLKYCRSLQVVDRSVSPWGTACDGARALSVSTLLHCAEAQFVVLELKSNEVIGAVFIVLLLAVTA